jgi:hypothetical protein
MWVKAKEREKNKEKHVNGAMFLTGALSVRIPIMTPWVVARSNWREESWSDVKAILVCCN